MKKILPLIIIVLAVSSVLTFIFIRGIDKQDIKVDVDLYVMSYCPYSVLAESSFSILKDIYRDKINININYIAELEGNNLSAMHGIDELKENMRQLVIAAYYRNKFWDYLAARNSFVKADNWQGSLLIVGIDPQDIESKVESVGKALLLKNIKKANDLGVIASPTVYINNKLYEGSNDVASLAVAICKEFNQTKPAICVKLPECFSDSDCYLPFKNGKCVKIEDKDGVCEFEDAVRFKAYLVESKDCLNCSDYLFALRTYEKLFRGMTLEHIDYATKIGKEVAGRAGLTALPAVVFEKGIESAKSFNRATASGMVKKSGSSDYYLGSDMLLKGQLFLDRKEKADTLTLFVMSYCPFSVALENALIEKINNDNLDLKLEFKYIFSKDKDGNMVSLHGKEEMHENIEQMIVQKYYPDKFFDYILCRNKDIKNRDTWRECATSFGMDPKEIEIKAFEENKVLVEESEKLCRGLDVKASPTIFWQNNYRLNNRSELKKINGLADIDLEKSSGSCR
ncbi:MAG: hypothetical protein P9L96_02865 [Candidatus Gygaella obscura]|nr:hypothetical protein [Candidatus Gygaella obscura]